MALQVTVRDGVAVFTLDNPPQNRLTVDVLLAFVAGLEQAKADESVRVVVVQARGENFSYGGDITPWPQLAPEDMGQLVAQGLAICSTLETLPVPVIAAVQGDCFGGGFEIALRADVIIATESARFRHPEATLGVITLLGGVQRVAERAGRARAARWALTAEPVSAAEALAAGVIAEVVPDDELESATARWAQLLARGATRAHAAHKQLLQAWSDGGVEAADALIPELTTQLMRTEDAQRGVASAVDALNKGIARPDVAFTGR